VEIFPHRDDVAMVNQNKIDELPGDPKLYETKDNFKLQDEHQGDSSLKGHSKRDRYHRLNKLVSSKGMTLTCANSDTQYDHRYEPTVGLKETMRVVLLHDLAPDLGLVNGVQGRISGFEAYDPSKLPRRNHGLSGSHGHYCEDQIRFYAEENIGDDVWPSWPIVQFDNGVIETTYPDCSVTEYGESTPHSLLSRSQVQLMAGYAMTIHKAQVHPPSP
jgi:ATP-dependent DNA helicase PIF1